MPGGQELSFLEEENDDSGEEGGDDGERDKRGDFE